jgi:hypothetical protein
MNNENIIVSRIDLVHTVLIRILSPSSFVGLTHVPVIDEYTNMFESRLNELNTLLLATINIVLKIQRIT